LELDHTLPPENEDTARDLVSPHQGSPEWVVPLGDRDGHLLVSAKGRLRSITLDGMPVGEARAATADEPWVEFAFERNAHSFIVASRFGPRPRIFGLEVFADGIRGEAHDRSARGLDWLPTSATPGDLSVVAGPCLSLGSSRTG
jgi:hypothetical protein